MRIFYASADSPFAGISSQLWRNNLFMTLVKMGHEVFEFTYDRINDTFRHLDGSNADSKLFIQSNRPRLSRELLKQISKLHREKPIDLFFSYFYDSCIDPSAIDEIKKMGIKTVNWYCNASYQLHLVKEISPHYDLCLVPEKFRLEDYRKMGANPLYCQEAANPEVYHPYDVTPEFDVVFIGQEYGDRAANIKFLRDQGIDIRVWGSGWKQLSNSPLSFFKRLLKRTGHLAKRLTQILLGQDTLANVKLTLKRWKELPTFSDSILGSPLSDEEMVKMYSRARINIGFSSCGTNHSDEDRILQIRLRDFEIPMSGGFYMIEQMKDLEEFFAIGKEIVCYENLADLAEKIRYYLDHPDERETIRNAGQKRCRQDHTWQKRFEMVFRKLELKN